MKSDQQRETLKYFNLNAKNWARKSGSKSPTEVNIIQQRNNFVIRVTREGGGRENLLDVGCGSGELVREAARMGIKATGIDFSKQMIAIAKKLSTNHNTANAKFICCSIFEYPTEHNTFDIISANGFIEYISYAQLELFLDIANRILKKGGSLILGSRNRLFNVFSLNEFTKEEIKTGSINRLIAESIKLMTSKNIKELANFKPAPMQKGNKKHANTGVDVSTRFQYTPVQLISILKKIGFETHEIYPVHIHGIPPNMKDRYPKIHGVISNYLQEWSDKNENLYLIPQSSSFMIHAIKK